MSEQEILSPRHPLIKQYRRLANSRHHRCLTGKLPLEGPNLIIEALRAGVVLEAVFYTRRYLEKSGQFISELPLEVKRYILTPALFKRMAHTDSPQEVAALASMQFNLYPPAGGRMELGLLLDQLQDPGNLGSIIRTAAASAADGVYYTPGTVDPYSPKVLRSTAGAVFHLPLILMPDPGLWLDELKDEGAQVIAASPGQGRYCWEVDLCLPTVFIIGNERHGVAPELAARADRQVSIPQPGWSNSLNAAVAAGIVLYEALRQRTARS